MDKLIYIRLKKIILDNSKMGNEDIKTPNFYDNISLSTTDPDKVYVIHLQNTNFTEIPEEIFYFMNLKKLHLYHPIKKLDERLAEMDSLKRIHIHPDCGINENDPIIPKLKNKAVKVVF